ncbi:hypothetical protein JCM33774_50990 [Actinophytocola sp. KF-1]
MAGVIAAPSAYNDERADGPPQLVCAVAASAADSSGTTRSLPPDEVAALVESTPESASTTARPGCPVWDAVGVDRRDDSAPGGPS